MASPIERLSERTGTPDEDTRVLEMTDVESDQVLDALSSESARATLRALFEDPATTTELADSLDSSVQNVHYHISNLQDAELVEPIDTVYSPKGNEMTVYGPANDPLVFVGDGDRTPLVRQSLRNVAGGLGVLALASLLVQWAAERLVRARLGTGDVVGASGVGPADPTPGGTLLWLVFEVLEPGLVFFLGCLVVAAVVTIPGRR